MSESEQLVMVDPADILADDNIRFGLKKLHVESLANSILELGEVTTPIEVEERDTVSITKEYPQHYRLTVGFGRHAAAAMLNKEKNAGVLLPARVKTLGDMVTRLKRQITENNERENLSPMDKALAISKLLIADVPRVEIRRIFAAPGGRKGLALQPLSNSSLNIHLNMLELPKAIQEKIHDGRIGVAAAYELGKVPADKRTAVVERAEADRQRAMDIEEKDEEKLLNQEKKLTTVQEEASKATSEMEEAESAVLAAQELIVTRQDALRSAQKEPMGDGRGYLELTPDEKGKVSEKLKAIEAELKAAEKIHKDAAKNVDKLKGRVKKASDLAAQVQKKLADARKPAKKKAVGPTDIKKAVKAEGGSAVKLNANEMRGVIDELAAGETSVPRVAKIGQIVKECFDGVTTPKQMTAKLYEALGLPAPKK